jgi:hypothetical protein
MAHRQADSDHPAGIFLPHVKCWLLLQIRWAYVTELLACTEKLFFLVGVSHDLDAIFPIILVPPALTDDLGPTFVVHADYCTPLIQFHGVCAGSLLLFTSVDQRLGNTNLK